MKSACWSALILFSLTAMASAAPITPTFDVFGELDVIPPATFGGSGIPTDPVAITTITDPDNGNIITLGLSAHGRIANPTLTHDGAGTYFAKTGANFGDPTFGSMPSSFLGATWNFGFYIDISGDDEAAEYFFELKYDFDPGPMTDDSVMGSITGLPLTAADPTFQGSENFLFDFLSSDPPPVPGVTPPLAPFGTFDPNAIGEYSLALIVSDGGGELGRSAIQVNTVPEPSSMVLLATGAIGLIGYRRRKRKMTE